MSMLFTRVNDIDRELINSFDMGDPAYMLLLGDGDMPSAANGACPVVVAVDTGKVAMLLKILGRLEIKWDKPWLSDYMDNNAGLFDSPELREHIETMIAEDIEGDGLSTISCLARDVDHALENDERMIYYYVS